jgi:V8-like Glu-specific endopeptidase
MRNQILFILLIYFCSIHEALAQISYGGMPLFLENRGLKALNNFAYIEMPSFDLDSVLRLDELNKKNMRGSYSFAYKFYTKIKKEMDGTKWVLPDGTKIWQVGIRSKGAYSINVLFTKYHLPEGGKLFIYNAEHSHILGAFDSRNNSPQAILPVRPVAGDEIIIEYSEPADAEFEAQLEIGEVNHDYRDILKREPSVDDAEIYLCMPDVLCENVNESLIRATVLIIINGNTACTGTFINNAENDEKPYLITAVHCMNTIAEFPKSQEYYIEKAGTVIAFFNYNRPVCGTKMKGSEEMSIAIASPRVVIEKNDIALLEFQEKPPLYYNAYYVGWNISNLANDPPYINLHHPSAAVKRYGLVNKKLSMATWHMPQFESNAHWKVAGWNIGSTYVGSSGSPIFNNNNQLIGTLTGGDSNCAGNNPDGQADLFAAFFKGWENANVNNQLKTYLDPKNTGVTQLNGFDPYKEYPFYRIKNVDYNQGYSLITTEYQQPNKGFLFGNSNRNVLEFAEEFNLDKPSTLFGAYFFIPKMPFKSTSGVEVRVYSGESSPDNLIVSKVFYPNYLNYNSNGKFTPTNKDTEKVPTECFIYFDDSINVDKKFFIAYKINYSENNNFVVYNASGLQRQSGSSAWIKDEKGWMRSNEYAIQPITTSLAIQPLVRYTNNSSVPNVGQTYCRYVRKENKLILPSHLSLEKGLVSIYFADGRLIEKIVVLKGETSAILTPQKTGHIGIVRITRGGDYFSGKFIY